MRKIWLWIIAYPIALWCIIICIALVITALLLALLPHIIFGIDWIYGKFGSEFNLQDSAKLPYVAYISLFGIAVTLVTVAIKLSTAEIDRKTAEIDRKKRNTLKILLETRFSKEFQEQLMILERAFPYGDIVSLDKFLQYNSSNKYREKIRAKAVIRVLNYYEFISAGIQSGNLDEDIMKESIRNILCSLVHDMQYIICHYREEGQDNFKHLIAVFLDWTQDGRSYEELRQRFMG